MDSGVRFEIDYLQYLDADDWEMLQSMITVYIKRWKGFKSKPEGGDK